MQCTLGPSWSVDNCCYGKISNSGVHFLKRLCVLRIVQTEQDLWSCRVVVGGKASKWRQKVLQLESDRQRIHRYIKQLFLVLGTRLAQFKRYCSVVKCVLDGPLDTHIWPFSRTLGEEILHLYSIHCFWVPFSGRISHHFPTKPSFSPIFRIARLFENFLYQSISILTWPGAFGGPILLTRTKPDMI